MQRKNMYIAAALAIVVVAAFVFFGFFNIPIQPRTSMPSDNPTQVINTDGTAAPDQSQNGPEQFLNTIREKGSVDKLLGYDTAPGEGAGAKVGDTVVVHYTGVLPDGTLFDTSRKEGRKPFPVVLGQNRVIQGWEQGLLGMKKGGRRLLAIPASLGYGDRGQGSIPPGATLIFDIEVLDIVPAK